MNGLAFLNARNNEKQKQQYNVQQNFLNGNNTNNAWNQPALKPLQVQLPQTALTPNVVPQKYQQEEQFARAMINSKQFAPTQTETSPAPAWAKSNADKTTQAQWDFEEQLYLKQQQAARRSTEKALAEWQAQHPERYPEIYANGKNVKWDSDLGKAISSAESNLKNAQAIIRMVESDPTKYAGSEAMLAEYKWAKDYVDNGGKYHDYLMSFEDNADYMSAVREQQAYDTATTWRTKVENDLDGAYRELEKLKEQQREEKAKVGGTLPISDEAKMWVRATQTAGIGTSLTPEIDKKVKQLEDAIHYVERQREYDAEYASLLKKPDFEDKAKYTPRRAEKANQLMDPGAQTAYAEGDLLYEYVNGNEAAIQQRQRQQSNYGGTGQTTFTPEGVEIPNVGSIAATMDDWLAYQYMTEEEVKIFNALYAEDEANAEGQTQYYMQLMGKSKAKDYLDFLMEDLNKRMRYEETKAMQAYAKQHPVAASIESVIMSPMKSFTYAMQLADFVDGGGLDQNAAYNRYSYDNTAIRSQVSSRFGETGSFLYNAGMSMADNLWQMLISGAGAAGLAKAEVKAAETLMLGIMATGAAADSVIAAKDRGLSDGQAFFLGTTAGAIEYVTEKIGMDRLFKTFTSGESALRALIGNALAEGSEEILSGVMNEVLDYIVTGMDSERMKRIQELKDLGYSEAQAVGRAYLEFGLDLLKEGAAGALSGGMFGVAAGGRNFASQALYYSSIGEQVFNQTKLSEQSASGVTGGLTAQVAIDNALKAMPKDSQQYKLAQIAQRQMARSKTGTPTAYTMGQLVVSQVSDIEQKMFTLDLLRHTNILSPADQTKVDSLFLRTINDETASGLGDFWYDAERGDPFSIQVQTEAYKELNKVYEDITSRYKDAVTQARDTESKATTTVYTDGGLSLQQAQELSAIVERFRAGEDVTTAQLEKLRLDDAKYADLFYQATGVQIDPSADLMAQAKTASHSIPPAVVEADLADNAAEDAARLAAATQVAAMPEAQPAPVEWKRSATQSNGVAEETRQVAEVQPDIKQRQLETLQQANRTDERYYAAETIEDILTYEEALAQDEAAFPELTDYDLEDARQALADGHVTIYADEAIQPGTFVSPSEEIIRDNANGRRVYSMDVPLTDVAWSDSTFGQYAPAVEATVAEAEAVAGAETTAVEEEAIAEEETAEEETAEEEDTAEEEETATEAEEEAPRTQETDRERYKRMSMSTTEQLKSHIARINTALKKAGSRVEVKLLTAGQIKNGIRDNALFDPKTGNIWVSPDMTTQQITQWVLAHELLHEAKVQKGTSIVDSVIDAANEMNKKGMLKGKVKSWLDNWDATMKDTTDLYSKIDADLYGNTEAGPANVREEIAAQIARIFMPQTQVWHDVAQVRQSLAMRLLGKLTGFNGRSAFDKAAQELSGKLEKGLQIAANKEKPMPTEDEIKFSARRDSEFMENARLFNSHTHAVTEKTLEQAAKDRETIKRYLEKIAEMLPPDTEGNTFYGDESYGGTEENTTVCVRSLAYEEFMDAVAEELGRPLTVEDTLFVSQEAMALTDKPECIYCYVAMDRRGYRDFLNKYIEMRDAFLKDVASGMEVGLVEPTEKGKGSRKISKDTAYGKFLNGKDNTQQMYNRAKMWLDGATQLTKADLASTRRINAAMSDPTLSAQAEDAHKYAQSASWAKIKSAYVAYNNHILSWSQSNIDELNKHYGLRFYSFADFSPAFILENMQQITDASVRGLKGLAYTKELDFVRIFAPSGININISVYGYNDGKGGVAMDAMQGADWEQTKELRRQYPNVGAVYVAMNDAQVEWALAQDWIDVVIPFHTVRTGAKVASMFGWQNYKQFQADKKNENWKPGNATSIYPSEHQNNKERYLQLCEENGLTPRFNKWVSNPNYMKLVNETRQSEGETQPMQPVFDMSVGEDGLNTAQRSLDEMVKRGGYVQHLGGSVENMRALAEETAEKIRANERQSAELKRSISPEQEAEYLVAVEKGDMETAQRMVDEAAKAAGYTYGKVYHGTPNTDFTEFNDGIIFFTSNKDTASEYEDASQLWRSRNPKGRTIGAYIKLDNPLTLDNSYSDYRNEHTPWQEWKPTTYGRIPENAMSSSDVAERAKAEGYDGVFIANDKDTKWTDSSKYLKNRGRGDTVIAFKAEQIKSADPVTYDDEGNVIPLSERFDFSNRDIRHSVSRLVNTDGMTEEQITNATPVVQSVLQRGQFADYFTSEYASYTTDRIEHELEYSLYEGKPDTTRTYIAWIDPRDFVRATTTNSETEAIIKAEAGELDVARMRAESQTPYLRIDFGTGEIRGHEGRHRMQAMADAGIKYAPVLMDDVRGANTDAQPISIQKLKGQYSEYRGFYLHNALPVDGRYAEVIKTAFGAPRTDVKFSVSRATFDPTELAEENARLQKDLNKALRDAEYWKRQTKTTTPGTPNSTDINRLSKYLIDHTDTDLKAKDIAPALTELYEYVMRGGDGNEAATWAGVQERAADIAHRILSSYSELANSDAVKDHKAIRATLRSIGTIQINAEDLPGDWSAFKAKNRWLKASINSGTNIDEAYQRLVDEFPWLFPDDLTIPSEQLNAIAEGLRQSEPSFWNPNDENMAAATEFLSNEIIDGIVSGFVQEGERAMPINEEVTYADRMQKKLDTANEKLEAQKAESKEKLEAQKAESKEKLEALRERHRVQLAWAVHNAKVQADEQLNNVKQYYRDMMSKQREKRQEVADRNQFLKRLRRLDKMKLPSEKRAIVDEAFGWIDRTAKSMNLKTEADLRHLSEIYNYMIENENAAPDPEIEKKIDRLVKAQVNNLDIDLIRDLSNVALWMEHQFRTAKKELAAADRRDTYAKGLQIVADIRGGKTLPPGLIRAVRSALVEDTLDMRREIRELTGYVDNDPLYLATKRINEGQHRAIDWVMRNTESFNEWIQDKAFINSLTGKNADLITISARRDGDTENSEVQITPDMRISLYLAARNEQNLKHITSPYGGVRVPDMKLYKRGKVHDAYVNGEIVHLTRDQLVGEDNIFKDMSDKEKAFAEAIDKYYNATSRTALAEEYERFKGYMMPIEEHYFPINTVPDFLNSKADVAFNPDKPGQDVALPGWLQERITGATSPVYLYDASSVLYRSIQSHGQFLGLAVPLHDFNKLYTMNGFTYDTDGNVVSRVSVRDTIAQIWGEHATQYIDKFVKDMVGYKDRPDVTISKWLRGARSRYAGVVLTLNPATAAKQTASYPTAMVVLGWQPLARALADFGKVDLEAIKDVTPLQWLRSQGYSNPELGELVKQGKPTPKVLNWIQGMDLLTTRKLWKACQYYMQYNHADLKPGTAEYKTTISELYNRVIEETQPNYTTMQRPALLRSNSELVKDLFMFKTQLFQNFGILHESLGNLAAKRRQYKANANAETLAAYKDAAKTARRAVVSQFIQTAMIAGVTAGWNFLRGKMRRYKDKKKDEVTLGSFLARFGLDMASGAGGMIPFGAEAVALISSILEDDNYYGIEGATTGLLNDITTATVDIIKMLTTTNKSSDLQEQAIAWEKMAEDLAPVLGIPVTNVMNLLRVAFKWGVKPVAGEYYGEYLTMLATTPVKNHKTEYYDLLYKAQQSGDEDQFWAIYNSLVKMPALPTASSTAEELIDAALKKRAGSSTETNEDEWAYDPKQFMDDWGNLTDKAPSAMRDAVSGQTETANLSASATASVNAELDRLHRATLNADVLPSPAPTSFSYNNQKVTLNPEQYTLFSQTKLQTSLRVINDLINTKEYQAMTDAEKTEALKNVYSYGTAVAKTSVSDYELSGAMKEAKIGRTDYGIPEATYFINQSAVSQYKENWVDAQGKKVEDSKSLLIMNTIYELNPNLTEQQIRYLGEALGVNKTVLKWNKTLIANKVNGLRNRYGKYN